MMKKSDEYRFHKASGIGDQIIPDLILRFDHEPPEFLNQNWEDWLENEGQGIAEALLSHLPGGVIDQIMAHLMLRRASLLKVRFAHIGPKFTEEDNG